MIVFDVDGTLIGGESADWASFDGAFAEVAGFQLTDSFFAGLTEVTAPAIVHQALGDAPLDEKRLKANAVCKGYLRRLREAHSRDPGAFAATEGASELLGELKAHGIPVAIATGDWRETISFKLGASGIPIAGIPLVTATEFYSRAEIIEDAVRQSGRPLSEAVYLGDGVWDLYACRKLGIRFIGVGRRLERLLLAGALQTLPNLEPRRFWRTLAADTGFTGDAARPFRPG